MKALLLFAAFAAVFSFGTSTALAAGPTKIIVAVVPADVDGNIYYAADRGFFKKYGLDVDIRAMSNGPAILAALVGGGLDIGIINVTSLAAARAHGVEARFVAPSGVATAASLTDQMFVLPDSPVHNAADLNGKTIAVTALGTLVEVEAKSWLAQNGGDYKSIKFIEAPIPQMAAMLQQHRADAAMISEPFASLAKKGIRSLGPIDNGIGTPFLTLGWCATDAWIAANTDTATRFAAAIAEASVWANAHHAESAEIIAKYTNLDLATVRGMERYAYGATVTPEIVSRVVDAAVRYGVLPKAVPAADLIWSPAPKPATGH